MGYITIILEIGALILSGFIGYLIGIRGPPQTHVVRVCEDPTPGDASEWLPPRPWRANNNDFAHGIVYDATGRTILTCPIRDEDPARILVQYIVAKLGGTP